MKKKYVRVVRNGLILLLCLIYTNYLSPKLLTSMINNIQRISFVKVSRLKMVQMMQVAVDDL